MSYTSWQAAPEELRQFAGLLETLGKKDLEKETNRKAIREVFSNDMLAVVHKAAVTFTRVDEYLTMLRRKARTTEQQEMALEETIKDMNLTESLVNTVYRSEAKREMPPGVIEEALKVIYEAVDVWLKSGLSQSKEMLARIRATDHDWNIEEARDSDGHVSPEKLTRKLWELFDRFPHLEHDKTDSELLSLSKHFCQELSSWNSIARIYLRTGKNAPRSEEIFVRINRAALCFPNGNESYTILSMLLFAPRDPDWSRFVKEVSSQAWQQSLPDSDDSSDSGSNSDILIDLDLSGMQALDPGMEIPLTFEGLKALNLVEENKVFTKRVKDAQDALITRLKRLEQLNSSEIG
ncbi:hypothetical protein ACEPAI_1137 [Sanghuangporus weigelae]